MKHSSLSVGKLGEPFWHWVVEDEIEVPRQTIIVMLLCSNWNKIKQIASLMCLSWVLALLMWLLGEALVHWMFETSGGSFLTSDDRRQIEVPCKTIIDMSLCCNWNKIKKTVVWYIWNKVCQSKRRSICNAFSETYNIKQTHLVMKWVFCLARCKFYSFWHQVMNHLAWKFFLFGQLCHLLNFLSIVHELCVDKPNEG